MMKALLTAAALVLAVPAVAAPTQRGVTGSEIVIGTYTDLSGVTAMWGVNNSNSWRMVFDQVNAAGGIDGRKIKYILEDNQYQVPRSVQAANKLINRDGVFILVANGGTPMNNAVMPEQIAKGVANVFPLTSARSMYEPLNHLKFGLGSSYYDQVRAGLKYFVEKRGKKQVCTMAQDTDFGRDITDGVNDELKALNMKLAGATLHRPTDTDFSASIARMREANCDLVVLGTIVRDSVQIISAARKVGWNVDMMGQAASYDEAVATVPGGATEGFYSMTPMLFVAETGTTPEVKAFAAAYQKAYGKAPNFAAQIGYTGAQITVQALKNAGKNLTEDSFVAGLESVKDYHDIFG
jgi:branched-chain amino acid transport system substrate-binding protein